MLAYLITQCPPTKITIVNSTSHIYQHKTLLVSYWVHRSLIQVSWNSTFFLKVQISSLARNTDSFAWKFSALFSFKKTSCQMSKSKNHVYFSVSLARKNGVPWKIWLVHLSTQTTAHVFPSRQCSHITAAARVFPFPQQEYMYFCVSTYLMNRFCFITDFSRETELRGFFLLQVCVSKEYSEHYWSWRHYFNL